MGSETPKPKEHVGLVQVTAEAWDEYTATVPYMNSNGLVKGCIPAGQPCPFLAECSYRMERCPSPEKLKNSDFSCAAARLHSMVKITGGGPATRAFLKDER